MASAAALEGLKPEILWKHFAKLASIPRASTKEAAAREYVLGEAKRFGLETIIDEAGNVVVRKPARPGRENATPALLQGHLDMVCEKNEGTPHNFDTDPIKIVRNGDWITADGTTLGSDNGLGVAAALAVMESTDIAHGPLEFVFTIDEETGLTGAAEFKPGVLQSNFYFNLDNEEKGTLCIGCAGGVNTKARRKVGLKAPKPGEAFRIKVSGLRGGHSGVDIHLGRGNALRILASTLQTAAAKAKFELADIKGGSAHNAIPREASAVVVIDPKREKALRAAVAQAESDFKTDLGEFDPGLQITVEKFETPAQVLKPIDAKKVIDLFACIPHGVLAMSPDVPGLVQDSTNFATASLKGDVVEIITSQRSAIEGSKMLAARLVATVCQLAGFKVEHGGSYPGWKPEPNSDIVTKLKSVYEELFGESPKLIAMHAGLECGVIGEKYPGMQLISFGPQIEFPHSPAERAQISSVESFWKYLVAVLEKI
jgi:dipeptidase D